MSILHQERLLGVHPVLIQAIQEWAALPFDVLILNGVRTNAQQAALYAQGRTAPGNIVTNAQTAALSAHGRKLFDNGVFGCALDAIACVGGKALWQDTPKLEQMAELVASAGVAWGGDWQSLKDYDHFEWPHNWKDYEAVPDDVFPSDLEG